MCLSAGFPRLIIYESLNVLFGLPLDSNLSQEWIYENILLGPWFIDISNLNFEPRFDPISSSFTIGQLTLAKYYEQFIVDLDLLWEVKVAIQSFDVFTWDGTFNTLIQTL